MYLNAGDTYLRILEAAKAGAPDMHVHAFSPLEVSQGAATLGLPVSTYLASLRGAGLGSLPGTAAEVWSPPPPPPLHFQPPPPYPPFLPFPTHEDMCMSMP